MESTTTRTVRFKKHEIERIEKFLEKNPLFDFSSLVRIAVEQFTRKPSLPLTPIADDLPSEVRKHGANV